MLTIAIKLYLAINSDILSISEKKLSLYTSTTSEDKTEGYVALIKGLSYTCNAFSSYNKQLVIQYFKYIDNHLIGWILKG